MMSKDSDISLTREQCRAGRALLGWSQERLSAESLVGKKALADFERGATAPQPRTLRDLRRALEAGGVLFVDADESADIGVRLRYEKPPR